MFRKFGIALIAVLALVALVWAAPQVVKHQGPLSKQAAAQLETPANVPSGQLPRVGSRDPNTLDEVILSENFDQVVDNELPAGWTQVDVDEGTCAQFAGHASTWRAYTYNANAHSSPKVLFNHYNDGGLPNDDWVILPQQDLTGTITFSYWIASQQSPYLEEYELRVSTTGTQPANFTNLIYAGNNIPVSWTQHTHDLSQFAGAPFYIAFHYISTDEFVIKVDDVLLERDEAVPHGAISGTVTRSTNHSAIANANVSVEGTALTAQTDAAGRYMFNNVPPSTYIVHFSYDYYDPMAVPDVAVVDGDTTVVNAELVVPAISTHDFASLAGNVHIEDLDTARKTLEITDTYEILDLNVTVNVVHTFDGDLTMWLQGPGGDRVQLVDQVGADGANFTNCAFDDEAAAHIAEGVAPFTGSFIPLQPLTVYDGLNTVGSWTLLVYDNAAQDTGHITSFSMHITSPGTGAVGDKPAELPTAFAFHGNYPNPFNATTDFTFDLTRTARVELVLYNLAGQEVARIADKMMEAGAHNVSFDASHLTSGLYFARLTSGGTSATQKVILLK